MPVFYEFKISVADRDDIDRSDDLEDMGIDSEPDWEDANCTIDLEKIWAFYPDSKYQTKLFFGNEKMIVHHKYEDVKEIFRKHYGVYPKRKHLDKKGISGDKLMSDFEETDEGRILN